MSSTKTEVANAAFVQIGADPVLNVEDNDGAAAIAFRSVFEINRSAFLEAHPYQWSLKTKALTELSGLTPAEDFTAVYGLPAGFLGIVQSDSDRLDGFALFSDGIHANSQPTITYQYDAPIDDFSATAIRAFTVMMAWDICIPVKGSNTMYANLERKYLRLLKEARQSSRGNRRVARPVSIQEARLSYGSGVFDASHPSAI